MFTLDEGAATQMELAEQEQKDRAAAEAAAIAKQQQLAAKEALAATEEAKWGKNQLILCAGEVVIHGCQTLPPKVVGIIQEIWNLLEKPFFGSTTFTRDELLDETTNSKLTGIYDTTTKSVVISLSQLWADCTKPECLQRMGMAEQVWVTLLQVISHEMTHAIEKAEGPCEARAKDVITTLAQKFDLECPAIMDMGWLGHKLDEWYSSIENSDEELHKLQRQMRMEGVPYIFASGKRLANLRQWFRLYHSERREETAWDAAVGSLVLQGAQLATPPATPHNTAAAQTVTAEQALNLPGMTDLYNMPVETAQPAGTGTMSYGMGDDCSMPGEEGQQYTEPVMPGEMNFGTDTSAQPVAPQRQQNNFAPWLLPSPIPAQPFTGPLDAMKTSTREIMLRAFMAIFGYCGWNGRGGYNDADFVARTPINVSDIPYADNILLGLDTVVDKRKQYNVPTKGILRGFVGAGAKLPQYSLHINHGTKCVRYSLIPQNPEKPSARGQEAASGQMFGWVTMQGEGKPIYLAKVSCPTGVVNRANMVFEKL